jgi:CheY-like chemotaxis protein
MGARILAVEDTPHNLELMGYLLRSAGHEVYAATTGDEGLRMAQELQPDLVVLDVQLPGLNGYEVLSRLRADPTMAAVPVIAVTAYAMVGDREHGLASGFDGYLAKPIDPHTFSSTINRYLPADLRGHLPHPQWTRT